ncbi:hypothetical protein [Paraglaciecola marina]|uniref:hypothetical protein n=1 Tax=Paraglaciecola marina TaxID=2500157 RepID=UPI00105DE935|nr:hypothetical protein [Paraglaciecola marina]
MPNKLKSSQLNVSSSSLLDGAGFVVNIQNTSAPQEIYFKSKHPLVMSAEVEATVTLLPAMQQGIPKVLLEAELDTNFKAGQYTVQNIYKSWHENFTQVDFEHNQATSIPVINSSETKVNPQKFKRHGMFFSGGMDSFYSFLKHQSKITDLIFVHGYDIKLSDHELRAKTSAQLHKVAEQNNVNLIEIETNLRDYLDKYVTWGELGHGAALISIGHLLSHEFETITIPSSYHYGNLFPWGTHPLLDPQWSSSSLAFIHDGCEAKRIDKAKLIATNNLALESLRVCWRNPDSTYNCCKCEKCIRTMINLEIYDALDRSAAFPDKLTFEKVRAMPINSHSARKFVLENLKALTQFPEKAELSEALTYALNKKPPSPPLHHRVRRYLKALLGRD